MWPYDWLWGVWRTSELQVVKAVEPHTAGSLTSRGKTRIQSAAPCQDRIFGKLIFLQCWLPHTPHTSHLTPHPHSYFFLDKKKERFTTTKWKRWNYSFYYQKTKILVASTPKIKFGLSLNKILISCRPSKMLEFRHRCWILGCYVPSFRGVLWLSCQNTLRCFSHWKKCRHSGSTEIVDCDETLIRFLEDYNL